jgi:hypothetical protein
MRYIETEKPSGVVPEAPGDLGVNRNGNAVDESNSLLNDLEKLFDGEKELVRELIKGLREIRYGSIVLTVHEGRVVEINKSTRIRKSRAEKSS